MAAGSAGVARWHIDYIANIPFQDVFAEFSTGGPSGGPPGGPPGSPPGGPSGGPPGELHPEFSSEGPPIPNDPQLRVLFDGLFRSSIISDLIYLLTLPYYKLCLPLSGSVIVNTSAQTYQMLNTCILPSYN